MWLKLQEWFWATAIKAVLIGRTLWQFMLYLWWQITGRGPDPD